MCVYISSNYSLFLAYSYSVLADVLSPVITFLPFFRLFRKDVEVTKSHIRTLFPYGYLRWHPIPYKKSFNSKEKNYAIVADG